MLTLDGIDVAIAGTRVLRGVRMDVGRSGRVALVGRNGAGKTTTLRAIMGLVGLSGGRIEVQVFAAGEVVPAFSVHEAVGNGTVELGHTASFFAIGREVHRILLFLQPFTDELGEIQIVFNEQYSHGLPSSSFPDNL